MKYALTSLLIPGLGQFLAGRRGRGLSLLFLILIMVGLALWSRNPLWFTPVAIVWLWNVWDAASPGQPRSLLIPAVAALVMFYVLGWQASEINPRSLSQNFNRALIILRPMFKPDFYQGKAERREGWVQLIVPCGETNPRAEKTVNGITSSLSVDCAQVGDTVEVSATGLIPNLTAELYWMSPIGDFFPLRDPGSTTTISIPVDTQGNLTTTRFDVPLAIPPGVDPNLPQDQRLYLRQSRPLPGIELSTNGFFVLKGIYETIALALMATTLGTLFAIPISFLAARNLMSGSPLTFGIYLVVRTLLNIVRSIESLIIAIIFVVIVGLGPFAGMLALAVHTIAALGKLFSEMIEGIDPGPIEAIRAVGGNWFQMVVYAVVPQIIPPFTAFTIYRWDINVRASTIIGFVGGGGIGFFLVQWINLGDFRAVSASFIAILVVVMAMDFFSARIRARLAA